MNITFAKNGYTYAGTLINNTDIAGQIESMKAQRTMNNAGNIHWVKLKRL